MINESALWTLLDQLQTWTTYVDYTEDSNYFTFLDAINQVMAELDTNSTTELCQDEPTAIPAGVPVWVANENMDSVVFVSAGNGQIYCDGMNGGPTEDPFGPMRPVCFPDWDQVPEWVACIELSKINGVWLSCFRQEVWDLGYGTYYERRPA